MPPKLYVVMIILSDVLGSCCLKLSNGFTLLAPAIGVVVFYTLEYLSFAMALKHLDLGYVYATWSAAGIAVMAIVSMVFFHEPVTTVKIVSLLFVILGVVGLQLS